MTLRRNPLRTNDGNREQTQVFYERGYRHSGFRHVHYLEVPGKGHDLPDDAWFERAIVLLDEPLVNSREKRKRQAEQQLAKAVSLLDRDLLAGYRALGKVANRYVGTKAADLAADRQKTMMDDPQLRDQIENAIVSDEARKLLGLGLNYHRAGLQSKAKEILNLIVKQYPDTSEAEQAKKLIQQITVE